MVQKLSRVVAADQSGVGWVQVFHLYGGSRRKRSRVGHFVKGAVKAIAFYPKYIRGKKYKPTKLGFVVRGLLMGARYAQRFNDNTRVWSVTNAACFIKKRGVFKDKYIRGCMLRTIRRRRYRALFKELV